MKNKFAAVLAAGLLLFVMIGSASATSFYDSMNNGGNRLVNIQQNDGGWDWPLNDGNSNNASPSNTIGPIAMGLAQAYKITGDSSQLTALNKAGTLLLNKTNNFSNQDGYLAAQLDDILGGSTYTDYVRANFYVPLSSGTYNRNGAGTFYDTAGYVSLIRTSRSGQGIPNLAAWDLGMATFAASAVGADTTEWIAGTKDEINELDGSKDYDVIGLAGAILGLSSVGEDFDPTLGEHAAAASLSDLANILASYQISSGGFAWNKNYVTLNNESVQETAYAIIALASVDSDLYAAQIDSAAKWLMGVQLSTGGWEGYTGSGENNEVTGEALWALNTAVPEPATMLLFGLGLLGLAGVSRKKTNQI